MASAGHTTQALTNATAFFNGQRLTMARQLAGLRKARLAELIGMSPASVTGWESGAKRPNRATVAKLALALRVEPQFFAGGPPPRIEKPHFRSLRSTPQVAQDEAEAYGQFVTEVTGLLEKVVELHKETQAQRAAARRLLYVGITRARHQVVIIRPQGAPALVTPVGAPMST